ncbi:MAG: hypothetical protein ACJAW8_002031 [Oleispira sp.]|jgi:hypothetical protein
MRIRLSNKVEELLKAFVVENQLEGVALSYLVQRLVIEAINNNNKKHREGQHNDLQRKNRKLLR